MDIDPVQERPGDLSHILCDLIRMAATGFLGVSVIAARASLMYTMTTFSLDSCS